MEWNRSDITLLVIAGYVAVMTLVRMMRNRRDALVADVQRQLNAQRRRKKQEDEDAESRDAA